METTLNKRIMKQSNSFVDKTPEIGQVMSRNVYGIGPNGQCMEKSLTVEDNIVMKNPESGKKILKQEGQGNILGNP